MIDLLRTTCAALFAVAALSAGAAEQRPTPAEPSASGRGQPEKPAAASSSKPPKTQKKAASKHRKRAAADGAAGEKKAAKPCEEVKPCAID